MPRQSPSTARRIAACAVAVAVLLPVVGAAEGGSLGEIWSGLAGKKGILEERDCGYVFTLSRPTQSGNAVVQSVAGDHVVLRVERDQESFELVVPLARIVLRRPQG